jgi:predicted secreted protein
MTQITAKVIAHSKSAVKGKEIITMELEYPRFIHGEFMTHRMFSRNAASSRAIPVSKMIEQVRTSPAVPCHWGKNQAGMQAKEELTGSALDSAKFYWKDAAVDAALSAEYLSDDGVHKQIVNRILEPFQTMKTVVTATEWENFYWLRNHEDAQPEIKRLAEVMLEAVSKSKAIPLSTGQWHVPYYRDGYWCESFTDDLEDALAISASCCAQVSYRLLDDSIEKARMVYKRLVESSPVHASPFEHQASPMGTTSGLYGFNNDEVPHDYWEDGVTHMDSGYKFWSGNFQGWIQHRQLIPNNVKRG